jgi:hypothetical protein
LSLRLDAWSILVLFPTGKEFSLLFQNVQTGAGAHVAFYSMATGPPFLWYKAAEAWSRPLTSNYCRVCDWLGLLLRSAIRHHSVHRGNFTLTLLLKPVFYTVSSFFISSLPFTPVYFLQTKCLGLPSVNFEHEADTTDMQPDAANHFPGILWMSTHLGPSVAMYIVGTVM